MENVSKQTAETNASITNRTQEMGRGISGVEDTIQENTLVKEKFKSKKAFDTKLPKMWNIMKRPNLIMIGGEEDSQLKGHKYIVKKNHRRNDS